MSRALRRPVYCRARNGHLSVTFLDATKDGCVGGSNTNLQPDHVVRGYNKMFGWRFQTRDANATTEMDNV